MWHLKNTSLKNPLVPLLFLGSALATIMSDNLVSTCRSYLSHIYSIKSNVTFGFVLFSGSIKPCPQLVWAKQPSADNMVLREG